MANGLKLLLCMLLLAMPGFGALAGCGGDDNGGTDPASLKGKLLPASAIEGFKPERTFEWDSAIDLTAEGIFLPAATKRSDAVKLIDDAGFKAAAGQELVVSTGNPFEGPRITVDVIELGSADDARKVLDYLHKEDLKQPCFSVCSQEQGELRVDGIPRAKGAQSVPLRKPPAEAPPPFEGYAVEFPIDSFLYVVAGGGGPNQLKESQVTGVAKALYERNSGKDKTPST
jgi:hypothetical protein